MAKTKKREAKVNRKTRETRIAVSLNIDGRGKTSIKTGIDFLDHMLELFAYHGLFDLQIKASGDLKVDLHHTNEDLGICLGQAFRQALGSCRGIRRFGDAEIPMDRARAKASVDISNRYAFEFKLPSEKAIGSFEPIREYRVEDAKDFLDSFAKNVGANVHIEIVQGRDTHHILEAVFKALGRAFDEATQIDPRRKGIPSTKGVL